MSRLMWHILFAALCLPILGIKQIPAAQSSAIGPAKIAWMDLEQALLNCDEGKQKFAEVQKFVEDKSKELETLSKELDTLRNQLNVQGSKLTDEARFDLEGRIEAKQIAGQRFQDDTQREIENQRNRTMNYIGTRMMPVIQKIAKEKGLTAVLYFNPNRDAWLDPSLDITDEVIKSYNQTYTSSTPAKAPAAGTPAKN